MLLQYLSLPPPSTLARASPWQPRTPTIRRHTPSKHYPYAKAKGFGEAVTLQGKKDGQGGVGGGGGGSDDDDIPQVVFDRMIVRILVAVATPMALGVGMLTLLGLLKEKGVWDVPVWFPFVTALALFGTSALGIAYGTLSTSLDPEKKGSFWGWEEAQRNWPKLWKEEEERSNR